MALPRLQLRRGTAAPSGSIALVSEPFFNTTGQELYVATGTSTFAKIGGKSYTDRVDEFLTASVASTSVGSIKLNDAQATQNYVIIDVPATVIASYSFTLPPDDGSSGQVLQTDGSGNTSWVNQNSGYTGWTVSGDTGTPQAIDSGNTLSIAGGSGISTVASATDTLTVSLNIDELTALDAEAGTDPLVVADSIPVYDASAAANKKVTITNLETVIFSDISGDITVSTAGVAAIGSGVIVDADISASAAISFSKLASLTSGNILVGNGSNVATSVAVTGDVTISNAGVTSIASGVIVDADISASAEIAVSKLADGTARQLLQTDAAGTGVEWASNIDIPGTLDVTSAATFDSTVTVTGNLTVSSNTIKSSTGNTAITLSDTSVTIAGDLTVNGTTTTLSTTNTVVKDSLIELANGTTGTPVNDAGLVIERGTSDNVFIGWDEGDDLFVIGTTTATGGSTDITPTVTGTSFLAGAYKITDTAGTKEDIVSYLAAGAAYTGSAAGRYLQNVVIDLGTF